ncbi:MAG TPA: helix-turn-helix domain-containing protein [Ferruginibacter sp.]|nr:helix-turn-helix domain-containing protein [Ferruginibacter sp.]
MQIQFFTPHPLLQSWVQCIMIVNYQIDVPASSEACSYPPTPQPSLFFYIGDKISVKKSGSSVFDIKRNHLAVRVGFHPGGLFRLMGVPMHEFIDEHYNAEDVFGKSMVAVNEQLHEARDHFEIKNIIESFLLDQLYRVKPLLPFDEAMLELFNPYRSAPIEHIASLACLSVRQFERVSRQRVGLPPKLFARIVRFSKAYRMREESAHLSWTDIAHHCGYFDQMHFIRDFKTFTGITPKQAEKMLQEQPAKMQVGLRL